MTNIIHVAETGSTNMDMLALAREGAAEGAWLYADTQTGGRGRQGRAWVSPPGNLYVSGLVRLREGDPPAASLALVAGVALWDVVAVAFLRKQEPMLEDRLLLSQEHDVGANRRQLKWPNDLLVNSAKLAGILLEREGNAVVIGIGLNLAHHPEGLERPVISLAQCDVMPPVPAEAVAGLAERTAHWLNIWRTFDSGGGIPAIIAAWMERAHPIGTPLSVDMGNGTRLKGTFAGLDNTGALILRLADGANSVIHAGDVFLV